MRRTMWLSALVLALPVTAVQAMPQQAPAERPVELRRPYTRDTVRMRALDQANAAEVMRVVNELRAREEAIVRQLEALPPTRIAERRDLEEQLARISREAFTMMSVIESRCIGERTLPAGYMGLNLSTAVSVRDRAVAVQRSVLSSVEPGSPAERAGLAAGDLLVTIAGRDARNQIPDLDDVLEPGRRLSVAVERDGRPLEFEVVVAPRPRGYGTSCMQFERAMMPLRLGGVARAWVQDSTDERGNRVVYVVSPATPPAPPTPTTPPARPSRPVTATAPTPPTPGVPPAAAAPSAFTFGSTTSGASFGYYGGAQFRQLDEDWRNVLGVKAGTVGVLVNEVASGSEAARAGLRVGDVITELNGVAASSPLVVVRLIGLAEGPVTLRVLRAREMRTVTLRSNVRRAP